MAPEAVIFGLVLQRHKASGEIYWTTPALWIVTRLGDHWGLQLRTVMPTR